MTVTHPSILGLVLDCTVLSHSLSLDNPDNIPAVIQTPIPYDLILSKVDYLRKQATLSHCVLTTFFPTIKGMEEGLRSLTASAMVRVDGVP